MTEKDIHDYLLSFPNTWLDYPFGEGTAVYKVGHKDVPGQEEKMYALLTEGGNPLRLSLKTDPQLNEVLQEKYETVLPGYHLNKKHWMTIICSGQVSDDELKDFMRLSYRLVTE